MHFLCLSMPGNNPVIHAQLSWSDYCWSCRPVWWSNFSWHLFYIMAIEERIECSVEEIHFHLMVYDQMPCNVSLRFHRTTFTLGILIFIVFTGDPDPLAFMATPSMHPHSFQGLRKNPLAEGLKNMIDIQNSIQRISLELKYVHLNIGHLRLCHVCRLSSAFIIA